jgi:DNA-binding transcriptional ArsR family regulator
MISCKFFLCVTHSYTSFASAAKSCLTNRLDESRRCGSILAHFKGARRRHSQRGGELAKRKRLKTWHFYLFALHKKLAATHSLS